MNNNIYSKESQILFSLIANQLFDTKKEIPLEGIDYNEVFKESKIQTIPVLAFYSLPDRFSEKFPDLFSKWFDCSYKQISNFTKIEYESYKIGKLLKENDITYSVIKGIATSKNYPIPKLRSIGDVDFIISESNIEKANDLLTENGYIKEPDADSHGFHIAYKKGSVLFEMHYRFSRSNTPESRKFTENIINNAIPYKVSGFGDVMVTDDLHNCMIMLYHIERHMVTSGMGLRHLYDWAVFVNNYSDDEFIEKFKDVIEKNGLWKFAKNLTFICSEYLGMPEKSWAADTDTKVAENLFEYFYSSGNFGRKSKKFDSLFTGNTNKSSNAFAQFLSSLKAITVKHWPKAKKNPFLLVIGCIWFPVLYFFRMITGKRKKVNIKDTLKSGLKTNETFKQLDIYNDKK